MEKGTKILLGGAALVGAYVIFARRPGMPPGPGPGPGPGAASLPQISLAGWMVGAAGATLSLTITNNSPLPIIMVSITGDVDDNGLRIGTVNYSKGGTINPGSSQ